MANITLLSRLLNGVQRQVNLSVNTLEVGGLQLDGSTSGNLQMFANATTTSYSIIWPAAQASPNTFLKNDGSGNLTWSSAGSGSVTSVNVVENDSANNIFNSTGGPITGSGTIDLTLISQSANMVFAGPATGSAATPTFRSLVANDIPALAYANQQLSNLSGTVAINLSLLPGADNSINLGSAAKSWATANIHTLIDGSSVISVDAYNRLLKDSSGVAQLTWSTSGVEINSANLNLNNNNIINVADPVNPQDAATKHYVDQAISGIFWKDPVQAISASANVPLSGSPSTNTLTIDGYSVQNGDSVILADQTTASQNGVYTASGIGGTFYTLTLRADSSSPQIGFAYLVENGTSYTNSAWQINAISPNTTFVQFAGPQELVFNSPLVRSGNDVSLNYSNGLTTSGGNLEVLASDSSILVASGGISVQEDPAGAIITGGSGIKVQLASSNPGLAISTNHLDVKYNPAGAIVASASGIAVAVSSTGGIQITSDSLALLLVASTALVTSASGLAWQFDNSTIGVNGSNQAYVPNAGITKTQINTNVFDQATITGGAGTSASVAYSPSIQFSGIAGQNFTTTNQVVAVRYGLPQNSETAGRLYAADITTSSFDLFWVVGFISVGGSTITSGSSILITKFGPITLGSSDTSFGSNDPGKPIFLQGNGIGASTTAPSTSGQAVAKLGIATSTTTFLADIGAPYVF